MKLLPSRFGSPPVEKEKRKLLVELRPPASSRKQMVHTEQGEKVKEPPPNALLGESHKKVEVETVQTQGRKSRSLQPRLQPEPPSSLASKGRGKTTAPRLDLSRFGIPVPLQSTQAQKSPQPEWNSLGEGEHGTKEYVKGVKESERTALNTREFVFFSYFHRIRQRLDQAWGPLLRARLEKYYRNAHGISKEDGGRLFAEREYEAQVLIYLNVEGAVTRVQLLRHSGADDLDASAVEAFNRAGPFPNPPKALIDENQEIKMVWNFILKT